MASAQSLTPSLSGDSGTATATAGAATLNAQSGVITTAALTTAQDAVYTLTLTNNRVSANSIAFVSVSDGTNSQGTTVVIKVTPGAGSLVIKVANKHASAQALNGTLKIAFFII